MKKTIFLTLILILFLAACGSNAEPAIETGTGTGFDPSAQELPLATKLAVGTLKLENTDLAIAPDQAADLLPLWQVFNDLSSSDTAAPEELTALTEQIQESMTSEQLQAIDDMGLTGQDIFATMQELELANAPQGNAEGSPQAGGGFSRRRLRWWARVWRRRLPRWGPSRRRSSRRWTGWRIRRGQSQPGANRYGASPSRSRWRRRFWQPFDGAPGGSCDRTAGVKIRFLVDVGVGSKPTENFSWQSR